MKKKSEKKRISDEEFEADIKALIADQRRRAEQAQWETLKLKHELFRIYPGLNEAIERLQTQINEEKRLTIDTMLFYKILFTGMEITMKGKFGKSGRLYIHTLVTIPHSLEQELRRSLQHKPKTEVQ